jgi:hypothetical protein
MRFAASVFGFKQFAFSQTNQGYELVAFWLLAHSNTSR